MAEEFSEEHLISLLGEEKAKDKSVPLYNKLLAKGQEHYNARKFGEAITIFREMLMRWPDELDVLVMYAAAHAGLGDLKTAFRFAQAVIAIDHEEHNAHIIMSHCYSKMGKYRQALEHAKSAVEHCPDDSRGYINKASALIDILEFRGARIAADRAIELDPSLPHGYHYRAFACLGESNPSRACDDGKKAFSINWERRMYPVFFDNALLGAVYLRLNNPTQAEQEFKSAESNSMTEAYPSDRDVYKNMLLVLYGTMMLQKDDAGKSAVRKNLDAMVRKAMGENIFLDDEHKKAMRFLGCKGIQ